MAVCFFIDTLAGQSIINIRHRYHLRRDWNLIPFQPIQIASSIISLMMPATDFFYKFYQLLILIHFQIINDLLAQKGVLLHQRKFFFGQSSRLIENLLVNTDLANVMKCRSNRDQMLVFLRNMIPICLLYQTFQQKSCQNLDVDHMHAAFTISEFHNMT